MPRQETRFGPAEPTEPQQVGWIAPRGFHLFVARRLQAVERIHAGPADYADNRLNHQGLPSSIGYTRSRPCDDYQESPPRARARKRPSGRTARMQSLSRERLTAARAAA